MFSISKEIYYLSGGINASYVRFKTFEYLRLNASNSNDRITLICELFKRLNASQASKVSTISMTRLFHNKLKVKSAHEMCNKRNPTSTES